MCLKMHEDVHLMRMKGGTCHNEHRVMDEIVESLHCTPETDVTLYVTYTGIANQLKKIDFMVFQKLNKK